MKKPVISVLMGVYYRRGDTNMLCRSIDSILQQNFSDFEFLICDDGSTQAAQQIIENYALNDSRIRIIRHGSLFALPVKLNACLKEAQGQYIARMDDDDYSYPDRFSEQFRYLSENKEVSWVGCNVNLCRDGETLGIRELPERPIVHDFLFTMPYVHPTLLFRRECLMVVEGYSEEKICQLCEDYDLLLRLYENGYSGANLQKSLLDYTIPAVNKKNRTLAQRFDESKIRYRHFKKLGLFPKAWPYVIKPVILGIIPVRVVNFLRKRR